MCAAKHSLQWYTFRTKKYICNKSRTWHVRVQCNGDQKLLKMNERSYLFTVTCLYSSLRNVTFYLLLYVGGQITLTAGQMSKTTVNRWRVVVSGTWKYDDQRLYVTQGRSPSVTCSTEGRPISMPHERLCVICFVVWPTRFAYKMAAMPRFWEFTHKTAATNKT